MGHCVVEIKNEYLKEWRLIQDVEKIYRGRKKKRKEKKEESKIF